MSRPHGFRFEPVVLRAVRETLKREYTTDRTKGQRLGTLFQSRLDTLLRMLGPLDTVLQIRQWAEGLEPVDVYVLLVHFPQLPEPVRPKILAVALAHPDPVAAWIAWDHFVHHPRHHDIAQLISVYVNQHRVTPWWDVVSDGTLRMRLLKAFSRSAPIGPLAKLLDGHGIGTGTPLMGLHWGDPLSDELITQILAGSSFPEWERHLADRDFRWSEWIWELDQRSRERAQAVLSQYLTVVPWMHFDGTLLRRFIQRWGNPGSVSGPWTSLSADARRNLLHWIHQAELQQFFRQDNARFQFWRGHLERCLQVTVLEKDTPRAAVVLDFGNVVAVEYAQTGNACYIYYKSDYERIRQRMIKSTDLKDSDQALLRLIHSGYWQSTFSYDLAPYIQIPNSRGLR